MISVTQNELVFVKLYQGSIDCLHCIIFGYIMKESQDLKNQVMAACLENVRNREEDGIEKERILNVIKKLPQSESMIESLNQKNRDIFYLLMDGFTGFRDSYLQLVALPEYSKCIDEEFNINRFLIKLIPGIVLLDDKLNHEGVISKFNFLLLRDFVKSYPKLGKEFLNKWREKAKDKIQQRKKPKSKIVYQQVPPPIAPKKPESVKLPPKLPEPDESSGKESPVPLPPKQKEKSEQELARQAKQREKEKQKQRERQKQREQQERIQRQLDEKRKLEERRQRQQNQKKSDMRERDHFRNIKGKAFEKYIDSREDLRCQKAKLKEIGEFLAAKLDQFLKTSLEQMYDIACLKNTKNPKFGNELGYFAEANDRVLVTQEFYFQPNTRIESLTYRHKHEIYSNLRIKEIKIEDDLRLALESKTNEGEKKIDKRIENYILKPRAKDTENMLIPFREERDGFLKQGVKIDIEHAIYFLENHPWLKSSMLLFEVYHLY